MTRIPDSIKIEHIDGDVKNNCSANLQWAEPPESAEPLDGEIWEPIELVDGLYEVSSLGRVRKPEQHGEKARLIQSTKDRCGIPHVYMRIADSTGGKSKRVHYPVHTLVALAFLHKPAGASRIQHIDGDYNNNQVTNIRWIDPGVDINAESWRILDVYNILSNTYEISSAGHIRNKDTGAILADSDCNGYRIIRLYTNDGNRGSFGVHRLVAATFLGLPTDDRNCVDHINGNRSDNRVENLRWATAKENRNNPITKERAALTLARVNKENNSRAVICVNTGETFTSAREAASFLGLSEAAVSKSCREYYKAKKYLLSSYRGKEVFRFKWAEDTQEQLDPSLYQQPDIVSTHRGRRVLCVETGIIYPSILAAATLLGMSRSSISNSCNRHENNPDGGVSHMGARKCLHFTWVD